MSYSDQWPFKQLSSCKNKGYTRRSTWTVRANYFELYMSGTYVKVRPYLVSSNFFLFCSCVPVANSGPFGSSILYRDNNITRTARPSVSKNLHFQTCSAAYPETQQKKWNVLSSETSTSTCWRIRWVLRGLMYGTNIPAPNGTKASRCQSPRNLEGLKEYGSSQ